jgi:hypothetical protein
LERISELENEIAELKAWDAETARYALQELPPGTLVRTLKQEAASTGEPIHSICTTCYSDKKISPLHKGETSHGQYNLRCYSCKNIYSVGIFNPPSRAITRPRRI